MNTYIVEITYPHDWYEDQLGTRFEVYQLRKCYAVKSAYDKYANIAPVCGILFEHAEKVCETCNHIKSMHNTAGGFCKHCTCTKFKSRRTLHAPDTATP